MDVEKISRIASEKLFTISKVANAKASKSLTLFELKISIINNNYPHLDQ